MKKTGKTKKPASRLQTKKAQLIGRKRAVAGGGGKGGGQTNPF